MDTITIDTAFDIAKILDFAYHECFMHFVTFKGKSYYPCDTQWYKRDDKNREGDASHDSNNVCTGYFDCYDSEEFLEKFASLLKGEDLVKYHKLKTSKKSYSDWSRITDLIVEAAHEQEDSLSKIAQPRKEDGQIRYSFQTCVTGRCLSLTNYQGFTNVKLNHNLCITNDMGFENSDHRGSNHVNINLNYDFNGQITIPAGELTIQEFVEKCYRIKGNKFDNQYELFCHFTKNEDGEFDIVLQDDEDDPAIKTWFATVAVDHGS